jgi:hypothetical protein
MKRFILLLILTYSFCGCAQQSRIISFEVDDETYEVPVGEAVNVKDGELHFSVKRINESAESRYEFMTKTLDFLDDYTKKYIQELDSYLILGSKSFGNDKTHLYHFFKKGNNSQGISVLVQCPYDVNEKYKEEIFRVVKSAHF